MPENEFGFDESKDFDVLDFGEKTSNEVNQRSKYIEENLWEKLEKANKRISLAKDILALIRYVSDSKVAWYRKAVVTLGGLDRDERQGHHVRHQRAAGSGGHSREHGRGARLHEDAVRPHRSHRHDE